MEGQLKKVISRKQLANQQLVADVAITEHIEKLRILKEELQAKNETLYKEKKSLTEARDREIKEFIDLKFKPIIELIKTQLLSPLKVEKELITNYKQFYDGDSITDLDVTISDGNFKRLSRTSAFLYHEDVVDSLRNSESQFHLTLKVEKSELLALPSVKRQDDISKERRELEKMVDKLFHEINDSARSKGKIEHNFKKKALESNEETKKMLDEARASLPSVEVIQKQLTQGE